MLLSNHIPQMVIYYVNNPEISQELPIRLWGISVGVLFRYSNFFGKVFYMNVHDLPFEKSFQLWC